MRNSPAENRNREQRRRRLAIETARLISEGGLDDFSLALRRAADRLGIHDHGSLPNHREIELALQEHQRLFRAGQPLALLARRRAAAQAMVFFERFRPRLVGAVLDGSADRHSTIRLHVFCDDEAAFARFLADSGIPGRASTRSLRLDRSRSLDVTAWRFTAEELPFELVVLPEALLRQPPLDPDGTRPMPRASLAEVNELLGRPE